MKIKCLCGKKFKVDIGTNPQKLLSNDGQAMRLLVVCPKCNTVQLLPWEATK